MKDTIRILSFITVLGMMVLGDNSSAQEAQDKSSHGTTRITLGSTSGAPGATVVLPLYLASGKGDNVGEMKLEVDFVSANLKFDRIERGIAAEMANVEVSGDVQVGKNDSGVETSDLTIRIRAAKGSKAGIPPGLLAYLTMKINAGGRPADITLRVTGEAFTLSKQPISPLQATDAHVKILAPGTQPAIVCFFFSH